MLVIAYDGTLNGDWVAHYAVRLAAHAPERRLRLLHVLGEVDRSEVEERVARIAEECDIARVALEVELLEAAGKTVTDRLLEVIPPSKDTLLVTGTRARPRNMAFLAGTVSARLLAKGRFPMVALRVVHPGVLGAPGRVLLPLAGHPRGASWATPLLALFGADLTLLHVLVVREVSRLRYRALGVGAAERLMVEGRAFAAKVETELDQTLDLSKCAVDASVVVSDDVPKEIVLFAAKHKTRLICLGASERSVPVRLVYGNPIERVLRDAPCDVAIYRSVD